MKIKRYNWMTTGKFDAVEEAPTGDYVLYSDVAHLVEGEEIQSNNACDYCVQPKKDEIWCMEECSGDSFTGMKLIKPKDNL